MSNYTSIYNFSYVLSTNNWSALPAVYNYISAKFKLLVNSLTMLTTRRIVFEHKWKHLYGTIVLNTRQ